jgi:hypothetical protein
MAGLALGLGATADAELVEFLLTRRVPPAEAVSRLAAQMPEGVTLALEGEYSLQESLHSKKRVVGFCPSLVDSERRPSPWLFRHN